MSFKIHLIVATVLRVLLIYYGEIADSVSEVPYTDVDYRVITDGASYLLKNESPFKRHTFRYSPLMAVLVLPNVLIDTSVGKLIFALFDLLVAFLIRQIILDEFEFSKCTVENKLIKLDKASNRKQLKRKEVTKVRISLPQKFIRIAEVSSYYWLYNPLPMVISTRGNGDSVSCAVVLASLYYLLRPSLKNSNFFISGLLLGLAIHLRLFPIALSLAYFLSIASTPLQNAKDILWTVIRPNRQQLLLVAGTLASLSAITLLFYQLYGYQFLYESLLYHLVRKDTRHNYSLFFYLQYLGSASDVSALEKLFTLVPPILLVTLLSFAFGRNRQTLPLCLFSIALVICTYNSVLTTQYFVWFFSLLPLCVKNLKNIGYRKTVVLPLIWFLAQLGWLLPAFLLEFKGWNTFEFIFMQCILFFVANILILQMLISNFDVSFNYKTN
jgi:GPI mannosyltransferase 1 subunit M